MGGGVTGVTIASELARSSIFEVDLLEKASSLGGFHRNFEVNGLKYDIGAFTFYDEHNLFQSFPGIIDLYQPTTNNFGSLVGKDQLDSYPCTLKGYIKHHGLLNFLSTCLEVPLSKLLHWRRNNIPAFVKYYVGNKVYHRTGLKNYIERLYKVSDDKIDIQFANKRLDCIQEVGSLRNIVGQKLRGQKNALTPTVLKSIYVRPESGFGTIYSALQDRIVADGVNVKLNFNIEKITKIETDGKRQYEIESAEGKKIYDEVVCTIPITVISKLIDRPLVKEFETIDLLTLFYRFNGDSKHNYNVLHNFTLEGDWKKITTFSYYYGKQDGDDYFSTEITLDRQTQPDVEQSRREFEAHVQSLGLYEGEFKFQGSLITRNAYPVYLKNNVDEILKVKNELKDWGLYLAGRQGEFDYLNSSDATANAVKVARQIEQSYLASSAV